MIFFYLAITPDLCGDSVLERKYIAYSNNIHIDMRYITCNNNKRNKRGTVLPPLQQYFDVIKIYR